LKRVTVSDVDTMKIFTSTYGVEGMRTFLSLERGDESLGDYILAFGKHEEVARGVFQYYGELLNSAERAESLVREVSECVGEACILLAEHVRENILNRAQKDLERAVRSDVVSEIDARMNEYIASAKEYVALFQEVGVKNIESVYSLELSLEDKERMRTLLKDNYEKVYTKDSDGVFKSAVMASLEKAFLSPDSTFSLLRDHGKIVSFNRFDTLHDVNGREVSYFGSFNADSAYSGVGSVMLEKTIKKRLEDGRPMMAHCDPTQPITKKYIEDGFIATAYHAIAGKPSFEIWRMKDSNAECKGKNMSPEELVSLGNESREMIVRKQTETESYHELQDGMSLTRFFVHEGATYVVFERISKTLEQIFVLPKEETVTIQKDAA